jgi:hypothetical protein
MSEITVTINPEAFSNKKFYGLTERQRKYRINRFKGMNQYNAARAAGYSHSTATKQGSRIERSGRVGLKDLMEQAGMTDKFLIEYAYKGLEATKLFGAEAIEHADWVAREKFFARILELEEKIQKAGINVNIDQSKHVTYVLADKMKAARERLNNRTTNATSDTAHADVGTASRA